MNGGSTASPDDDDPLGPVVESFLDRFRRGERPALSELIARYPELAGSIRELIPALVELEQLGRSTGSLKEYRGESDRHEGTRGRGPVTRSAGRLRDPPPDRRRGDGGRVRGRA